jgi:quercetin dioxygenase-like cupin family protein
MLHVENAQVGSQPVGTIEGQPSTGTFFVKPLMRGETMALLEIRVQAGAASAIHMHSHESLIYVVSGRLKTTIDNETFVLGPGDVCRHPFAVGHRVEALEDTIFVEIKSPPIELRQVFGIAAASGEAP